VGFVLPIQVNYFKLSKFLFLVLSFNLFISISFAQNEVETFFSNTKFGNYNNAELIVEKTKDLILKKQLANHLNILKNGKFSRQNEKVLKLELNIKAFIIHEINRAIKAYTKEGDEIKAFEILRKCLSNAKKENNTILICESLKYILEIYERFHIPIKDTSYKYFIQEYNKYAYDDFETKVAFLFEYRIIQRNNFKNHEIVVPLYHKALKILNNINSPYYSAKRDLTYFTHHQDVIRNLDSCEFYFKRALRLTKNKKGYFEKERYKASLINKASFLINKNKSKKAIEILDSIKLNKKDFLDLSLKKFLYYKKHLAYEKLNMIIESCKAYNEYINVEVETNQAVNSQKISEYETKYQTAKKEKQILVEQQKNRRNRNIAFGLAGLLLSGSLIFFFIQKSTKRKQLLAEQEKELQIQKVGTLLKEQELASIDAMIEGQEKERQRIANDLHDDLGGMMATVKLHFNALRDKPSEELYTKTDTLLDEAYQKVRSIAHAKNSGVIAKDGLLKSIKEMAQKVSSANNLQIEVLDHGLENRLENSLELTIFRIIQELITNVIKHAEATEVRVHLTQHEDSLNIMVEDNGKGFNTKQITKQKGMGLSSIDKRVDHLNGKLDIESEPQKGTNIIIDIPI